MKIYLDNASTTALTSRVKNVLRNAYEEYFGNPSSIHFLGRKSRSAIENSRKRIAHHLNASVGEIFFTSSATEANNMVLRRSILDLGVTHIITSPTEHHCILHTLDALQIEFPHIKITKLEVDHVGIINMNQLQNLLAENKEEKTLVSIMFVNNEIGTIQDMATISKLCDEFSAFLHCDAVQYIAKYPLKVNEIKFSFVSSSAHKFHGPKGIGFLYMNQDNIIKPMIYGGAQERNMRAGTENLHGIIAMAEALDEAISELETRSQHIQSIKNHFVTRLTNELKDIRINGSSKNEESAYHIVSVSFPPTEKADMLMFNLDIDGIMASSGSACSSGIEEDSHVLQAIKHEPQRKSIRFSFSHFTTMDEIDATVEILKKHTPTI